jgi:hypothetical protein
MSYDVYSETSFQIVFVQSIFSRDNVLLCGRTICIGPLLTLPLPRKQLKARLNSFENPATNSLERPENTCLERPEHTVGAGPTLHRNEVQTSARETRSRRKRNYDQVDGDGQTPHGNQAEPPAMKRRSRNMPINTESCVAAEDNSVRPVQQIHARSQMVIEIVSRPSQPAMPGQDGGGQFNYVEDEVDDDCRPPRPTTPISAITRSGEEERRDVAPLPDETSLPLSERILRLNKVIEPDYRMIAKDTERGRKRASNRLLLTKDGKVDIRSLCFLGDQENQTPSRWSLAPEAPHRALDVASQQLSDPLELPVLPSIERFETAPEPRPTPQARSGSLSSSITPRNHKPFKCGSCKKQYTTRAGLKYASSRLPAF